MTVALMALVVAGFLAALALIALVVLSLCRGAAVGDRALEAEREERAACRTLYSTTERQV